MEHLENHYERRVKILHYEYFYYKTNIRLYKLYYVAQSLS